MAFLSIFKRRRPSHVLQPVGVRGLPEAVSESERGSAEKLSTRIFKFGRSLRSSKSANDNRAQSEFKPLDTITVPSTHANGACPQPCSNTSNRIPELPSIPGHTRATELAGTQKPYQDSRINIIEGCSNLSRSKKIGILPLLSLGMIIDFPIVPRSMVVDDDARNASTMDALAQGISLSRLMINAGDALPVPYVKSAAGVILALLEPIQQLQRNQDDHKELTIDIAKVVWMMREMTLDPNSPEQSPKLTENIATFEVSLLRILEDLNKTMVKYSYMKQMWKTYSISQWLASSQKMVHELRMNMLLVNTTDTRRHVHAIHNAIVKPPSEPGSPRLESSISADELSDFVRLVPGDLELVEIPNDPSGSPADPNENHTDHNTVKIVDTLKTSRFYNGPNAAQKWDADLALLSRMRDLRIIQLFGICSSARRPALVFHEELRSIPDFVKKSMLTPIQYIVFTYNMLTDYRSARSYLTDSFPTDCMAYPCPAAQMYYTGCACPPGSAHSYRLETYVNSLGKLHLSIYTDQDIVPENIHRHGYDGFYEFVDPIDPNILGMITRLMNGIPNKSTPSVQTKQLILWAFHGAILRQAYVSDAILLPSEFSQQESITFGEICATKGRDDLDAVRRHPPRGEVCVSIGKAVFPGSIRRLGTQDCSPQCETWHHPGAIFEDIADQRRFTITRSAAGTSFRDHISCTVLLRMTELDTVGAFWLSHASLLHQQIQPYLLDPNATLSVITDVECSFEYPSSFVKSSYRPDIEAVYLFVHHLERNKDGMVTSPRIFWSIDAQGTHPMDAATMSLFGLRLPTVKMRGKGVCWSATQLEAVRQFNRECGFDPDSDEVAQALGRSITIFQPASRLKRRGSVDFEAGKLRHKNLQQQDRCVVTDRRVTRRHSFANSLCLPQESS